MTRKDYISLASAIFRATPCTGVPQDAPLLRQAHANTALTIADELARDNPRFDRARFLHACGIEL